MDALICDPETTEQLIARRRDMGVDQYDEVWDGVYVMSPMANNEHQSFVGRLNTAFEIAVEWAKLGVSIPGVNVSDRKDDWQSNYRVPDVAVFLNDTQAENCDTFWYGGPDFAVEIVSPGDKTREKLDFYAKVGTRELLIIDRDPWALELCRFADGKLASTHKASVAGPAQLKSNVVPLTFALAPADPRPAIQVAHDDGQQRWVI
ncbi:MAG: Uma2 family endonuclease [Planctomycetaceae bacterium]